ASAFKTYSLSLHDALPISQQERDPGELLERGLFRRRRIWYRRGGSPVFREESRRSRCLRGGDAGRTDPRALPPVAEPQSESHRRSEEHTSELQSHLNLVCR